MAKKEQSKDLVKEKFKPLKENKKFSKKDDSQEEEERNGIIPEDTDLKKFLGCGG
ncbi:hypothetical protein [Marivirga sp.]|uniref:hypothetical protein n=1 Tax=Marivirga sp. TaxID=2018662 RepID=UPI002D7EAD94|nr:hypothetical protein [Marivirga sp.]HET8859956.1 hypothetical protein [Marivirga sp.]